RFMRQTHNQRAYSGRIALALILDPGNPNISLMEAPGVLHLPIKDPADKPFALLHAKVALLGFRPIKDAWDWQLRLLVSTGNWTRATLEDSLDLVWRIDLSCKDLQVLDNTIRHSCADIKAAWEMFDWLKRYFDTRILAAAPQERNDTESGNASRLFEDWVGQVSREAAGIAAHYFDNRERSLLEQLPTMIEATGATGARNYLAMGSGFYESSAIPNTIPSVLNRIVNTLKGNGDKRLLTGSPTIDVFVNPQACQAVADSVQAIYAAGWTVRAAKQPGYFGQNARRALHAKFIFSANERQNSNICNRAWVYLGSGNLTGPGFAHKMARNGGNLEVGVVFAPDPLYWKPGEDTDPAQVLTHVLPVQREDDFNHKPNGLMAGDDMPERASEYIAAPVAWLFWHEENHAGWLQAPGDIFEPFDVIDETDNACQRDANGRISWSGRQPRQVQIRWIVDRQAQYSSVPILDQFGRFAATALPTIDLEEAWWQLANFPMPLDDEDLPPVSNFESSTHLNQPLGTATSSAQYPVRQMMQLIENIAAKQTAISQADWPAWCVRLEQCLIQTAGNTVLKVFLDLAINPLSPLWQSPFRPYFAETADTPEGSRYEDVLRRVETNWAVARLDSIGAQK
ncbi:MAG: hypothetical protein IAF00_09480, partial [Phycisphaerales bacterium]|nr:hypothetical protein [Phycisphaerales bacterium]